jgi:glyoxylate reductase
VFVTRVIPQPGIDLLGEHVDVAVNESDVPLEPDELRQKAAEVDALVTLLTDTVDRSVLQASNTLKAVTNVAVGFDNIDVPAATEAGVAVTNTPGVLTDTTADFAWTLLMAIARRVVEADAYMRGGRYKGWGIQLLLGQDIHHATLGVVGMGRIGQGMARRASGFDMRVLYSDEVRLSPERELELNVTYVDVDTLLAESDFISLHTPLTPETRHFINSQRIALMKPTACLINTSRGPVVNEADLARALRENRLAGAALDVFENEPEVHPDLLSLANVILAPHIASASVATRTRMATMAAENCLAILSGHQPPNPVNPVVLQSSSFKDRMQRWA